MKHFLAILGFMLVSGASSVSAQEQLPAVPTRVDLDHGIFFTLPPGWVEEKDEASDTRKGKKGALIREFACRTELCRKHTQETCSARLFAENFGEVSDDESFRALYADPFSRYARLRSVRISTSDDAEFRRLLAPMTIGPRDWWVVETDARHNMKSGLFADTIIGGWHLRMTCRTCETGKVRHQGAMAMLQSVERTPR